MIVYVKKDKKKSFTDIIIWSIILDSINHNYHIQYNDKHNYIMYF